MNQLNNLLQLNTQQGKACLSRLNLMIHIKHLGKANRALQEGCLGDRHFHKIKTCDLD